MNDVMVPDGLPSLGRGGHPVGSGEACVMELVSVIAGEEWSDHPDCVHPFLADAAIIVNDMLPDNYRHLIVPHIGRFFGTNHSVATVPLHDYFQGFLPHKRCGNDHLVHESFMAFTGGQMLLASCPCCTSGMTAVQAMRLVQWLDRALGIAERALHKEPRPITATEVLRAREAVLAH